MEKLYVYRTKEEDLYSFLLENPISLVIKNRENEEIIFESDKLLEGFELLEEKEIKFKKENWKKFFRPIKAGEFLVVQPWINVIKINPATAFGTGAHPSTKLILKLFKNITLKNKEVLDIGTGSGILSIGAVLKGAKSVLGIDIDPFAIKQAKKNAKINGIKASFKLKSPSEIKKKYDIVLANLEIDIFRRELKNILNLVKDILLVSGLYKKDKDEFLELLKSYKNFNVEKALKEKSWHAFLIRKND